MMPAGRRRSLRLKLDPVRADQEVEGFRALNRHSGLHDPTSIRTGLLSTSAQGYLPTPRFALVRLVIDRKLWGAYPHQQLIDSGNDCDLEGTPRDLEAAQLLFNQGPDGPYPTPFWAIGLVGAQGHGAGASGRGKKGGTRGSTGSSASERPAANGSRPSPSASRVEPA